MTIVKATANEIKKMQKATIYGVGYCAIKIFESLLSQKETHLPVSTYVPEDLQRGLGRKSAYLSLPSKINKAGAFPSESYDPGKAELACIKKSYDVITSYLPNRYC